MTGFYAVEEGRRKRHLYVAHGFATCGRSTANMNHVAVDGPAAAAAVALPLCGMCALSIVWERTPLRPEAEIRAEKDAVHEEINRQFWLFTRTAKGKPVDPELTRREGALEAELRRARHY